MLNLYKSIEIIVSLQLIIISTLVPVYIPLTFKSLSNNVFEVPITMQIPTIILLTLIFDRKVVFKAFTIYLILGLFILPVFHQGGSIGYLLTPNFGYLLGIYPMIIVINKLNKRNKINIGNFLKNGFFAIFAMHITGITYNFIQTIFYNKLNIFLYNLGKYSIGNIGYHLIMLIPLIILLRPIKHFKYNKQ